MINIQVPSEIYNRLVKTVGVDHPFHIMKSLILAYRNILIIEDVFAKHDRMNLYLYYFPNIVRIYLPNFIGFEDRDEFYELFLKTDGDVIESYKHNKRYVEFTFPAAIKMDVCNYGEGDSSYLCIRSNGKVNFRFTTLNEGFTWSEGQELRIYGCQRYAFFGHLQVLFSIAEEYNSTTTIWN